MNKNDIRKMFEKFANKSEAMLNVIQQADTENGAIPFMGGRPNNETVIQKDDITNLQITLGGERDVLDVINEL